MHWACYSRAEVALNYLLSLNPDLEIQDDQGYTALHLAVKSVEQLKSTRPVRALLLKGANREARDHNNKRPVDMISEHLPYELIRELRTMLVRFNFLVDVIIEDTYVLGVLYDQDTTCSFEA